MLKKIILLAIAALLGSCGGAGSEVEVEVVEFSPYAGQKTRSTNSWYVINATPPFGPRDHASVINIKNRIHLSGGFYRGPASYQDYWISDDYGVNWTFIHGNKLPLNNDLVSPLFYRNPSLPGPYARFSYFDELYWLIDESVWYSIDGLTWIKNDRMIGDINGSDELFNIDHAELRYSIDPNNNLIWDTRAKFETSDYRLIHKNYNSVRGAAVYSLGNHLFIAGGSANGKFNNYVLRSLDGKVWKRLVDKDGKNVQLPWLNIQWPCAVRDRVGRVWLIGGYDISTNKNVSDVWYTVDGYNWVRYEDAIDNGGVSALFPRHATACVYDNQNNRIISIAGKGGLDPNNDNSFVTNQIIGIPIN